MSPKGRWNPDEIESLKFNTSLTQYWNDLLKNFFPQHKLPAILHVCVCEHLYSASVTEEN